MNNSALDDLLNAELEKAEAEAAECEPEDLLIDVFRKHYENWTERLFPAWKSKKRGSNYELLAEILRQGGHPNMTSNMVAVYIKRVRDERYKSGATQQKKILKATSQGVTPTVAKVDGFATVNRKWSEVVAYMKGKTEWDAYMEECWNHLKWILDTNGIFDGTRDIPNTFSRLIGESANEACLELKTLRKKLGLNHKF